MVWGILVKKGSSLASIREKRVSAKARDGSLLSNFLSDALSAFSLNLLNADA